jgi:hypothetical protein
MPPPIASARDNHAAAGAGLLSEAGPRRALSGFYVSGVLLGFLGAVLLPWEHHLLATYGAIALYFAGLIGGLVASAWLSPRLLEAKGVAWTLAFASALGGLAFLYLAFVSPPYSLWWRVAGMAGVGAAAGILHTAVFHAVSPMYRYDPAATVNLAGMLFGLGCLTDALLISGTYFLYSAPAIQAWMAVLPASFGWLYWRSRFPAQPVPHQPPVVSVFGALRQPGAVLLSLLLFFQLGNEWAVAGWLAVFLSQRLGISPTTALWMLALYWATLVVGRAMAQWLLSRVRHARMLAGSVAAAVLGSVILSATNNSFGATAGILMVGGAFAPIYPLVVEKIGVRFPAYHPGFYNGLFSFAMAGGLLVPCLLGLVAKLWGVGLVMVWPLVGACLVFLLVALLWLEARLSLHAPGRRA